MLLAVEAPEFTAPMGLTLDIDRVKVSLSKIIRNRMRLQDRFNKVLLHGDARKKALEDPTDLRCRARITDSPAIQVMFALVERIEACEGIFDEKVKSATIVQLYKQLTTLVTVFDANNTRLQGELWELVELNQRQTEHKDKIEANGLDNLTTAQLRKLRDAHVTG